MLSTGRPKLELKIEYLGKVKPQKVFFNGKIYTEENARELAIDCTKGGEFEITEERVRGLFAVAKHWNEPDIESVGIRVVAKHFRDVYQTKWFMTLDGIHIARIMEHPDCVQIPRREFDKFILKVLSHPDKALSGVRLVNKIRFLQCDFEILKKLAEILKKADLIELFPDLPKIIELRTLEQSKEKLEELENAVKAVESHLSNKQQHLKRLKENQQDLERLKENQHDLDCKCKELEQERLKLTKQIEKLGSENDELRKENDDLRKENNDLKASIDAKTVLSQNVNNNIPTKKTLQIIIVILVVLIIALCTRQK